MGLRWYVARTEPRAEFIAAAELARDGYDVFFPRITETNPRPGHTETPLFPGYLFLHCDPEAEAWPSFRTVHRMIGWVSFGGEVPCLPERDMVELMQSLELINRQGGMLRKFSSGEKVHVDAGGLQGLAEVVEGAKSARARVKVLLWFMGRLVQAQVPLERLRPLEDGPEETQRFPRRTRGKGRWVSAFRPVPGVTG